MNDLQRSLVDLLDGLCRDVLVQRHIGPNEAVLGGVREVVDGLATVWASFDEDAQRNGESTVCEMLLKLRRDMSAWFSVEPDAAVLNSEAHIVAGLLTKGMIARRITNLTLNDEDWFELARRIQVVFIESLEHAPLPYDQVRGALRKMKERVENSEAQVRDKIFLVHGHDDTAKQEVARFLERLGMEAIILHEQASGGRTIIEKLEEYSKASFAIVLLTPDDECRTLNVKGTRVYRKRPRQNVVLELGFFVGLLGRGRVCAVVKGNDLEIPSDIIGVVWVELDLGGAWKTKLANELRHAGVTVDAEKVLRA